MRRTILLLLCFLCGLSWPARAQEGVKIGEISRQTPAVIKVMEAARCEYGALMQVLEDSRIPVSRVRKLLVGQEIYYSGDKCQMVVKQALRDSVAKVVQGEKARLASLEAEVAVLAAQRDSLLKIIDAAPARKGNQPFISWLLLVVGVVIDVALVLAFYIYQGKTIKTSLSPLSLSINYRGKDRVLELSGIDPVSVRQGRRVETGTCLGCKLSDIPMTRALFKEHLLVCKDINLTKEVDPNLLVKTGDTPMPRWGKR